LRTILLVDQEVPLLTLLQDLLALPGERNVEIQEGMFGLTADLMLISSPHLIVLNPRMEGLPESELVGLMKDIRARSTARVLFMADLPEQELHTVVAQLGADAGIPIRKLLEDPVAQLGGSVAAAPAPHGEPDLASLETLDSSEIMEMDMVLDAPPSPRAPTPMAGSPEASMPRPAMMASHSTSEHNGEVVALILAELASAPVTSSPPDRRYAVVLDTFSDHNLFTEQAGPVGVFVASVVMPSVGDEVTVDVSFPWGENAAWTGSVSWTRTAGMGALGKRRKAGFGVLLRQPTPEQTKMMQRFAQLRAPMAKPA
jgi:hypothetical protein